MNILRPAVRLGRNVFQRASDELSNGSTSYLFASEMSCISLSFSGILAARSFELGGSLPN